jgi:hypothetical protein
VPLTRATGAPPSGRRHDPYREAGACKQAQHEDDQAYDYLRRPAWPFVIERRSHVSDDVTVYLVVNDFGSLGRAFVETDIAEADRETVIRNFLSGQYSNALRVVAFNTAEGWSRDVSEDIAGEVLERAFDADDNLGALMTGVGG